MLACSICKISYYLESKVHLLYDDLKKHGLHVACSKCKIGYHLETKVHILYDNLKKLGLHTACQHLAFARYATI
jgi:hypothetical protein